MAHLSYAELVEKLTKEDWDLLTEKLGPDTQEIDREAAETVLNQLSEELELDLQGALPLLPDQTVTQEALTSAILQFAQSQVSPLPEPSVPVLPDAMDSDHASQPETTVKPPTPQLNSPSFHLNPPQEPTLTVTSEPMMTTTVVHNTSILPPPPSLPSNLALISKLQASISDFESLPASSPQEISSKQAVIRSLKRQLARLNGRPTSPNQEIARFRETCNRSIYDIFHFYSNKISLLGKSPSFDLIQHNSETWNISKFVRFLQDFGLLQGKKGKELDISTVKVVFARNSRSQKEMDLSQFHDSLSMIADLYYTEEADRVNGTDMAGKTAEEKRDQLYRHLHFEKANDWMKRATGFGLPFTTHLKPIPKPKVSKKPQKSQDFEVTFGKKDGLMGENRRKLNQSDIPAGTVKPKAALTLKSLIDLKPEDFLGKQGDFDLSGLIEPDSPEEVPLNKSLFQSKSTMLKPIQKEMFQRTMVLSQEELRRSQEMLNKSMKLEDQQRERGQRVLSHFRHVSHH